MSEQSHIHASEPRFTVVYRITTGTTPSIKEIIRDICVEQTVEIPYDCIPEGHIQNGIIGNAESCTQIDTNTYEAAISYRYDITGFSIPQFLNIMFGNISLKNGIQIIDLCFNRELPTFLPGPAWGIEGIRELTGIFGRPLTCTALKPMGTTVKTLSKMAGDFATGGIDIIKDDHGLTDQPFHKFEERIARCSEAIEKANSLTGHRTLYFPNISGSFQQIESQVYLALKHGIRGVLVAPMLLGLDTVRHLSTTYNLIIMAHPAFAGGFFNSQTHGISPAVLLGTLFRLIGSDISIFPNFGGRFPLTERTCVSLANALRNDFYSCKRSFPCPAGGMGLDKLSTLVKTYDKDSILLIGGALLQKSNDLVANTSEFISQLNTYFKEEIKAPVESFVSSCAWHNTSAKKQNSDIHLFKDYTWVNRTMEPYKTENQSSFSGITRTELIGKFGERTSFDLRYFELKPSGYSSFEKHVHEHVIIGVRGKGTIIKGEKQIDISVHDIVYIAPLEKHQIRNSGTEPFGFFCIVDHERDRPTPVE